MNCCSASLPFGFKTADLKLQTRRTTVVRVEQGSIEWHQNRKIAADLFSGINYNTKISEKILFSGLNLSISTLQVPKKPELLCITIS